MTVYDVLGRAVHTLLDDRREPGAHRVTWDGRDDAGQALSSGTYLVRLEAGVFRQTRQIILLK